MITSLELSPEPRIAFRQSTTPPGGNATAPGAGRAPVAAKALAARHKLPPRHLETLLQALVHARILKGVRGPRGGYELARERRHIPVGADPEYLGANSVLLERVIDPTVRREAETFLNNLDSITVEQMCETAEKTHVLDDESVNGDFRYLRARPSRAGRARRLLKSLRVFVPFFATREQCL